MLPTALAAPPVPRIALTVRVYHNASLPTALQKRALAEAESVLQAGLVTVHWQECSRLDSSPGCDASPGRSEFVLVVREGIRCQDTSGTLGQAWVVRQTGGMLAAVNVHCVALLAETARTDVAVLLGRVVAHELGHLMMRTSSHARRGLMRPNWTADEVRRNRTADWAFTAADVAAMRQPGTE
jgi:hypothetical protein